MSTDNASHFRERRPIFGSFLKFRKMSGGWTKIIAWIDSLEPSYEKTRYYKLFRMIPLIVWCFLDDAFSREFKNNENKNSGYFRL